MLQRYSVWAPEAQRVDVHLGVDGARVEPMSPEGGGWWSVDADPGDGLQGRCGVKLGIGEGRHAQDRRMDIAQQRAEFGRGDLRAEPFQHDVGAAFQRQQHVGGACLWN